MSLARLRRAVLASVEPRQYATGTRTRAAEPSASCAAPKVRSQLFTPLPSACRRPSLPQTPARVQVQRV
jgi:hypothetical protein